jgi:peptide-methionine (S)-S-oxide reductase
MSASERLPSRPSKEHLRKQAKRLAKAERVQLAEAQRRVALAYGFDDWPALMHGVDARLAAAAPAEPSALSPLARAALEADDAAVAALLVQGEPVDGRRGDRDAPLRQVCRSTAPAAARLAVATRLLDAGADVRRGGTDQATPLHAAATHGPVALVELLIRRGAMHWQADRHGRTPLEYARAGTTPDRDAIVTLLDRPVIRDARFRQAVQAIHAGDAAELGRLLDEHPDLLRMRAVEPDCYPADYFRDPKLFWFIANNPTVMARMPATIVEVADAMIARGVEPGDLDYALELVMTSSAAREQGHQWPLALRLLEAGATPTAQAIVVALAYKELAPIRALLERGLAMTAPIAAALGQVDRLADLLPHTTEADRRAALAMAVVNGEVEAARLCLAGGADPDAFMPVHKHCVPLHTAVLSDDLALLGLLVEHGARLDIRDGLWRGTPLDWAVYLDKPEAAAYLRSRGAPDR